MSYMRFVLITWNLAAFILSVAVTIVVHRQFNYIVNLPVGIVNLAMAVYLWRYYDQPL